MLFIFSKHLDDLISHQRDTAHDEQHRTGILRDFEALVFHGIRNDVHTSYIKVASPAAPRKKVMR